MKNFLPLVFSVLFAVAASSPVQSQDCTELTYAFTSMVEAGGPTAVDFVLFAENADGEVIMEWTSEFTAVSNTVDGTFCLPGGCYWLQLTPNTFLITPNTFMASLTDGNGEDWPWELEWGGTVAVGMTFCLDEVVDEDCPMDIDYAAGEGCEWQFEIGSWQEGEAVTWYFGDGTVVEGGHFAEHMFTESGVYEVAAFFTSEACPEGVELWTMIEVTDCEESEQCDLELYWEEQGECGVLAGVGGEDWNEDFTVHWYINEEFVEESNLMDFNFEAWANEPPCVWLTAVVEGPGCEGEVVLSEEVCLEDCWEGGGGDCELDITAESADGMWYLFTATGAPEGALIEWWIDGNLMEATGPYFEAGFDFNPFWTVCASYEMPDCPEGVEACYSNMGDCPDQLIIAQGDGCWYYIGVEDGSFLGTTNWYMNQVLLDTTSPWMQLELEPNSVYTFTAYYTLEGVCDGAYLSAAIETGDCMEGSGCLAEIAVEEVECDLFQLHAPNLPEGTDVWWIIDGVWDNPEENFLELEVEEGECTEVQVYYETPACPFGAFGSTLVCNSCEEEEDCSISIEYEEVQDGIFIFTAYEADGSLTSESVTWYFDEENTIEGNPVAYTWWDGEPGWALVCVDMPESEWCPEGAEACVEVELGEVACEEVTLVISADVIAEITWTIEWIINAEIDGMDLGGFDLSGILDLELGEISDTLTFCFPLACFELGFVGLDNPAGGLEGLLLTILSGEGLEEILVFDPVETALAVFGFLEDCITHVDEDMDERQLIAFPIPTSDALFVQGLTGSEGTWQFVSLQGRQIAEGNYHGDFQLDVSGYAPGPYALVIVDADGQRNFVRLTVAR